MNRPLSALAGNRMGPRQQPTPLPLYASLPISAAPAPASQTISNTQGTDDPVYEDPVVDQRVRNIFITVKFQ